MVSTRLFSALALLAVSVHADSLSTARAAWREDRPHEALRLVEPLLAASPDDASAVGLRGRIHFDLARFDEALADLARAAELEPETWGDLAREIECRVAFYRCEDAKVRELLPTFEASAWTEAYPYLLEPDGMRRHQLDGGRYVVYVDEALAERRGEVFAARMLELIYDAYSSVFPFEVDPRMVSRVYVFGKTSEYQRFSLRAVGSNKSSASGYFSPSTRILVIDADPERQATNEFGFCAEAIDTLFHEGFHQFVQLHVPQGMPDWLNEGMAEYFGPSTARGKRKLNVGVVVKHHPTRTTRYERIRETLRDHPGSVWSVERFMQQTDDDFDAEGRGLLNYAQAWSLVHFFVQGMGSKGRTLLKGYFSALREGRSPAEAYAETFGELDARKLDKAWRAYVLRL
ncbi:MAG: DUF1570 domain-containing protein [Planctomycetota bacterium]